MTSASELAHSPHVMWCLSHQPACIWSGDSHQQPYKHPTDSENMSLWSFTHSLIHSPFTRTVFVPGIAPQCLHAVGIALHTFPQQ